MFWDGLLLTLPWQCKYYHGSVSIRESNINRSSQKVRSTSESVKCWNTWASYQFSCLTLICVGFLGVPFVVVFRGGAVKYSPCPKLMEIMLENWNLLWKCKHIWSFRKYTFLWEGFFNFDDDNIFFKKSLFFRISNTFTQSNSVRAALEIFSSDFSFDNIESYCLWKY